MKNAIALRLFLLLQVLVLVWSKKRPEAVIRHPVQMIVDDDREEPVAFQVTLDGSLSRNADSYEWSFVEGPASVSIVDQSSSTNVTIPRSTGTYKFRLRVSPVGGKHSSHTFCQVLVQDRNDVAMDHLAKGVVDRLLGMQYEYLLISQQFTKADNYYPNVAEYFRKLSTERGAVLQSVIDYVIAKQATVDLTSSHPADHVSTMMKRGFPNTIEPGDVTHTMASSFEAALDMESKLANDLGMISLRAEKNHDYDLSQFAATDLLFPVTKLMHEMTSHLKTVFSSSPNDFHPNLRDYLFDKYLK